MSDTTLLERTELSTIPIDYSWSFADKTIKDTSYITHGYYTYPAKFISQLAARLIKEHQLRQQNYCKNSAKLNLTCRTD